MLVWRDAWDTKGLKGEKPGTDEDEKTGCYEILPLYGQRRESGTILVPVKSLKPDSHPIFCNKLECYAFKWPEKWILNFEDNATIVV